MASPDASGLRALKAMLARLNTPTSADPRDIPTGEGKGANEAAKDWHVVGAHNALAELRALSEKDSAHLPTIRATLQSHIVEDETLSRIHSGAIITAIHSHDDTNFSNLSGCAGHLLEEGGNFYIALSPAKATSSTKFWRPQRKTDVRWVDLVAGLQCEVRYEGTWFQAVVLERLGDGNSDALQADACLRVAVQYVGFDEEENREEITKCLWQSRIRAPSPSLHLYGLSQIKIAGSGDGIRIASRHLKSYGYVGDFFNVIEAIMQAHLFAVLDASGDSAGKWSCITQSITKLLGRKRAFSLTDRNFAVSAAGADVYQHEAISSIQYDVEVSF